jgi:predicted MFS family arabinose efflux permease
VLADFKKLMATRFLFNFAVEMQAVILGWHMYNLTHDPLHLGLIGLAEAVPALSLAMFAGYIVDRSRPLFIYKFVLYFSLLSAVVLYISQSPLLALGVQAQVLALYLSSLITGTARGFSQPAMYSIVPRLLPRSDTAKASAWMGSVMQVARIGGPAVGGLVFGFLGGVSPTAALVCVCLLVGIMSLHMIKADPQPAKRSKPDEPLRRELLSGARFVFTHGLLLPALSLDMISVLFGGVTALLPIYAQTILHVGPEGLGLLRASPAVGAAAVSIWMAKGKVREKAGTWLFSCVFAFGICNLVFALSRNYWLSFFALLLSGGFDSVSAIVRSAAVQLVSPDHMRGRISAINAMFIGSSNELGEFESGVTAKLMGTVQSAVFGSVMSLLTVATMFFVAPRLRRLNLRELEEADSSLAI